MTSLVPRCSQLFAIGCALAMAVPPASAQSLPLPTTNDPLVLSLDADMQNVILLYDAIKGTPAPQLTPQDARQQFSAQDAAKILARGLGSAQAPTPLGKVVDGMTIPGESGTEIPIRVYYPQGAGPFPVVVYFHGGGFVVATIDTYDESARSLCVGANAIVVSVEYRKAPEHPFPAARNDAITAYKWVTNNIGAYNGIAAQVAVAGESAGGNLAAEVSLAARNQGLQMPTHQLLIYPETNNNLSLPSEQVFTDSALPLSTAGLIYFDTNLVFGKPQDVNSPELAPVLANLKKLEPTTIIAADEDPLLSDGQVFAAALKNAGDVVTYQLYTGVTHEFFGMGAVVAKAKAAESFGAAQLAASFTK